jgi:hypothetical protein
MGIFNWGSKKPVEQEVVIPQQTIYNKMAFSTPFLKIKDGDLSKPYISSDLTGSGGYVRFGADNLYGNIINQMYFTSPLHQGIIEFKKNSMIGDGYEYEGAIDITDKLKIKTWDKTNKIKKNLPLIARDIVMFNAFYAIVTIDEETGEMIKFERVAPSKVRLDDQVKYGFISENWLRQTNIKSLPVYRSGSKKKEQLFVYQIESPDQQPYPLPNYTSAMNWIFLAGESSLLHKSNIVESIFPSMIVRRPKRFLNEDEKNSFIDSLVKKKGADNAGFVWVMTSDSRDDMPEVQTVQVSGNDGLMLQSDYRQDEEICRSHQIDPLIMGIRVSGKLGSGNEYAQAYKIFEKNWIRPHIDILEEIINDLMSISKLPYDFKIIYSEIIEGEIEKVDQKEVENVELESDIFESVRGLSAKENQDTMRIIRDFKKDRMPLELAKVRLRGYGISEEIIMKILNS